MFQKIQFEELCVLYTGDAHHVQTISCTMTGAASKRGKEAFEWRPPQEPTIGEGM